MISINCIKIFFIILLLVFSFIPLSYSQQKQFNFSWQFEENNKLKPRGGTSRGASVILDTKPNPGWLSVQQEGISGFEKDRRAILSMAGTYRTSFNFIETVPLKKNYKPDRPYQSWATEYIEVIEDSTNFISLQHILVMYFLNEDDEIIGPFTSKHWRQDWKYEDQTLVTYQGKSKWEKQTLKEQEVKGKWTQAVYQVDDSPRYESIGKWEHRENYSNWTGNEVLRPLPRREFSVRKDYDVLSGINTHIITPNGWVHEQQNLKLVLNRKEKNPYIAKEIGVNRYERIVGKGYDEGKKYIEETSEFWKIVRDKWKNVFQENSSFRIKGKHKKKKLFEYLFEYADEIRKKNQFNKKETEKFVTKTINNFVHKKRKTQKNIKY